MRKSRIVLLFFALTTFFFTFRLFNLTSLPPFSDETAYLYWTEKLIKEKNIAVTLQDATGPVFMLATAPLVILTDNYLLSGRLTSVVATYLSMILVFILSYWLSKNKKIAFLSSFIYTLIPLSIVHGRTATLDALNEFWELCLVSLSLLLTNSRKNKYLNIFLLSFFLVLGILTKPSVLIVIPFLLLIPLFRKNIDARAQIKTYAHLLSSIVIGLGITAFILLPFQQAYYSHYQSYHKSVLENAGFFLTSTLLNIRRILRWFQIYLTTPTLLVLICGTILSFKGNKRHVTFLSLWIIGVIVLIAIVGSTNIFPRYLMGLEVPTAILLGLAAGLAWQKNKLLGAILLAITTTSVVIFDMRFLAKLQSATLAKEDQLQFFEDWTSGYGLMEVAREVHFLKLQDTKIIVDDQWLAYGLHLFYGINKHSIDIREDLYFHPQPKALETQVANTKYLIFNRQRSHLKEWQLEKIWSYDIPPRQPITIYKIESK